MAYVSCKWRFNYEFDELLFLALVEQMLMTALERLHLVEDVL